MAGEDMTDFSTSLPAWMRFFWVQAPPNADLGEKKRTVITNGAALFVGLFTPFFAVLNFIQGQPGLAMINAGCTLVGFAGVMLLRCRHSEIAALVVIGGTTVLYTLSSLLFRNGMEYTLLTSMFGAVFMFESALLRISTAVLNAACFLGVKIHEVQNYYLESDFPLVRYAANLVFFLVCYHVLQDTLRKAYAAYHRQIEQKNAELAESRRRLHEEHVRLLALAEELRVANHAKEKLFSIIAHDLRAPVAGLNLTLNSLDEGRLEADEFKALLGDLTMNVGHVHECLDALLTWSASQLRGISAVPAIFFLADATDGCIGLLAASAARKAIIIKNRIPLDAQVRADENQVQAVLRNIVANALKFTPSGGAVEIDAVQGDAHWLVTVSDSGTGMSSVTVRDLFLTASASPASGTENERGWGLGLTICREFVESNGGVISVESAEGAGSRFRFTLPAATRMPA
jgi:two-component system, sensor histidine kinase and response regulator